MNNLSISERQVRGVAILDLAGEVTLGDSSWPLYGAIRQLIAERKKKILLNLARVTSIDSSGLGELVAGFWTVKAAGGSLKLVNMAAHMGNLLTITKLYTVFEIYKSEASGIEAFERNKDLATQQPLDHSLPSKAKAAGSLL